MIDTAVKQLAQEWDSSRAGMIAVTHVADMLSEAIKEDERGAVPEAPSYPPTPTCAPIVAGKAERIHLLSRSLELVDKHGQGDSIGAGALVGEGSPLEAKRDAAKKHILELILQVGKGG